MLANFFVDNLFDNDLKNRSFESHYIYIGLIVSNEVATRPMSLIMRPHRYWKDCLMAL